MIANFENCECLLSLVVGFAARQPCLLELLLNPQFVLVLFQFGLQIQLEHIQYSLFYVSGPSRFGRMESDIEHHAIIVGKPSRQLEFLIKLASVHICRFKNIDRLNTRRVPPLKM